MISTTDQYFAFKPANSCKDTCLRPGKGQEAVITAGSIIQKAFLEGVIKWFLGNFSRMLPEEREKGE